MNQDRKPGARDISPTASGYDHDHAIIRTVALGDRVAGAPSTDLHKQTFVNNNKQGTYLAPVAAALVTPLTAASESVCARSASAGLVGSRNSLRRNL